MGGTNSKPEPKKIKNVILTLLACEILTHSVIFNVDDDNKSVPIVVGSLRMVQLEGETKLGLHDDSKWEKIHIYN